MGCIFTKLSSAGGGERLNEDDDENQPKKVYSWDKKDKMNALDFTIDGERSTTVGRMPGKVNGQQFIIKNCEDCNIFIFDHCASVFVDDCVNCRMFIGPIKQSIFVRDCTNCVVVTACQQFRSRDCKKLDLFLSCVSQPIIESTTGVKFGCFQYYYPDLAAQFCSAGVSVFSNQWNNIHDFTPVPGECNFAIFPSTVEIANFIPNPSTEPFNSVLISTERRQSVVPYTVGVKHRPTGEGCLVAVFACNHQREIAIKIILNLQQLVLVQTSDMRLSQVQAKKIFGSDKYYNAVDHGNVVMMEFTGNTCIALCHSTIRDLASETGATVHASVDEHSAHRELEETNNLIEMQMAV